MKPIGDLLPENEHELTFDDWYLNIYPKHAEKEQARQQWEKLSDKEKHLATIDPPERLRRHAQWKNKQMIPSPRRYLLRKLWTDAIIEERTKSDEIAEKEDGTPQARLWSMLRQNYGDKLVRAYGDTMPWLWRRSLEGLTAKEVASIMRYLSTDNDIGLPDLPKINRIRRIGRGFGNYKRLPAPPVDKDMVENELMKMREILA